MTKLSKSVLEKIKEGNVKPIPRWQFVMAHVLLWSVFVFSIVIGTLATSILLKQLLGVEWDLVRRVGGGPVRGVLLVLPYLWFVALGVILLLSYFVWSRTKQGYKVRPIYVVLVSVIASLVGGGVLYSYNAADKFDDFLHQNFELYFQWREKRDELWLKPEEGVLAGRLLELGDGVFKIEDVKGNVWEVEYEEFGFPPKVGAPVVIEGEKTGDLNFSAENIRPRRDAPPRRERPPKEGSPDEGRRLLPPRSEMGKPL